MRMPRDVHQQTTLEDSVAKYRSSIETVIKCPLHLWLNQVVGRMFHHLHRPWQLIEAMQASVRAR